MMRTLRVRTSAGVRGRRGVGTRARGDRGATAIFVAVSMVAVLIVAALAIDGAQMYSQHRQVQNAADAAAMAGTRALDKLKFPPAGYTPDLSDIAEAVDEAVDDHDGQSFECWLVRYDAVTETSTRLSGSGAQSGTCNDADVAANYVQANGVEVDAASTRETFLAQLMGYETSTASADAAAATLPYVGGRAPFLLCGLLAAGGYDVLNVDGTIKSGAYADADGDKDNGPWFVLQMAQFDILNCGASSNAWKGVGDETGAVLTVGQWATIKPGNGALGVERDELVGVTNCAPATGPNPEFDGCRMLLPIVSQANDAGGSNIRLLVTNWAVFEVFGKGSGQNCQGSPYNLTSFLPPGADKNLPSVGYCGRMVTGGITGSGQAGGGDPLPNVPRVIKLTR